MEDGDLAIQVGQATVRLQKPIAYQEVAGEKQFVSAQFKLEPNAVVKFRVGTYDHSSELIVDPILIFQPIWRNGRQDSAQAVAVDAAGNIYVTGYTTSADFPTTQSKTQTCPTCGTLQGNSDVFVSKLDPTGHTLLVSTYVGGTSDDFSGSVAVDSAGNMVVTGTSSSTNFPNAGSAPTGSCQVNVPCLFAVSVKADGSGLNYSGVYGPVQGFASKSWQSPLIPHETHIWLQAHFSQAFLLHLERSARRFLRIPAAPSDENRHDRKSSLLDRDSRKCKH